MVHLAVVDVHHVFHVADKFLLRLHQFLHHSPNTSVVNINININQTTDLLSFGCRIDARVATRSSPSVRLLLLAVIFRRLDLLDAVVCDAFRDVETRSFQTVAIPRLGAPFSLRPHGHLVLGRAVVQQGPFFLSISQIQVANRINMECRFQLNKNGSGRDPRSWAAAKEWRSHSRPFHELNLEANVSRNRVETQSLIGQGQCRIHHRPTGCAG